MDASAFWSVIGEYNQATLPIQIVALVFLVFAMYMVFFTRGKWIGKAVLGFLNLYIAIMFFAVYGIEKIQRYFALPLFLGIGILFIYEAIKNKDDEVNRPTIPAGILMVLYLLYPAISMLLGASFPQMVTHIMPCPVVTISTAVYSCYKKKNRLLLVLLTIWGLTGVKSVIFSAYEDLILLLAGLYGVYLIVKEIKIRKI